MGFYAFGHSEYGALVAVVQKCWVVEIQYQAMVWAIELVPGGEHKEEITHPWICAETSSTPGDVLRHCSLLFSEMSWIEDVWHKHLRLSKWKVISNPFYYCLNFAFYVEN